MPPQPLQQLKEILAYGVTPLATKQELETLLKALLKVMKDMQDKSSKMMSDCMKMMDIMKMDMGTMDTEMMKQSKDYAKQMVDKSMATLEAKMPTMPDLSGLDTRITTLENEEVIEPEDIATELPKLGISIRDGLELISTESEKLKIEAIGHLPEKLKQLSDKIDTIPRGKGGGGSHSYTDKRYNLSLQTNGTLKVFTVPKSIGLSQLHMSDFPYNLIEGFGFTLNASRTQLTMTIDNAPSSGSALIYSFTSPFNY